MAASTSAVNTQQSPAGEPKPNYVVAPVQANAKIFDGTMVAIDEAVGAGQGYAIMAGNAGVNTQRVMGISNGPADISTNADIDNTGLANGAQSVKIRQGAFWLFNNSSNILVTDIGKRCYAVDDHTVDKTDGGGTRPFAGIIVGVDTTLVSQGSGTFGKVLVEMGADIQAIVNA